MASNENENMWQFIEEDSYLLQFVTSHAEKNTDINTSVSNCSLTASEQLAKLSKGINTLEKELQNLINVNHVHLISQGTWIYKLEGTLQNMQTQLKGLVSSVNITRQQILEPYEEIEKQCLILTRLHDASNILRCMLQIQHLAKNIGSQEILQASAMIREVDEFCQDVDLSGIILIEDDRKKIQNERQNIWKKARSLLNDALNNETEEQATVSIQVFVNLNILKEEISDIREAALAAVSKNVKIALDIQSLMNSSTDQEKVPKFRSPGPGRVTGGTFPGVNVAAFRSKLWSNWSNLLETVIYPRCVHMYILQVVISKQNQSTGHLENFSCQIEDVGIAEEFWNRVSEILSKQLISASEESTFIKQTLESEYPKLLRLNADLSKRLQKLMKKYPLKTKNTSRLFQNDYQFGGLFENAYLSRSVSRLLDIVHGMFSSEGLPKKEDLDKLIKMLSDELKLSLIDDNLCRTVVKNVGKAIRVFCMNCEELIVQDGTASQVIDIANASQQLNVNIANTILYVKEETEKLFSKNHSKLIEYFKADILKEYAHADELINNIMQPIVNSITEAIESIILTIHRENFQIDSNPEPSCSLYIRELQSFISRTYNEYLKPFHHQALLEKQSLKIANKCIDLFLRHVCLVRPLSAGGRQKISEDFKKIEVAIFPLCPEINNLGDNFKVLRAFRSLVTISDPQQIPNNELIGKMIPFSLVSMFLFSYAPSEIPSPHESCNWSVARLSQWLDNHHSERERLELISGALQRYEQDIRQQNKTTFHNVYPIMRALLESGFKSLSLRDN